MIKVVKVFVMALCVLMVLPFAGFASEKNPVIFVHGMLGNTNNFNPIKDFFVESGNYDAEDLSTFSYNYIYVSIPTSAGKLKAFVDDIVNQTGKKVNIVGHSLGAVVTRYYLKEYAYEKDSNGNDTTTPDALAKVDTWISLGGPNHGCDGWNYMGGCTFFGFTGMCAMKPEGKVISELNAGDPTPQGVDSLPKYITIVSEIDQNACCTPQDVSYLDGATNITTEDEWGLSFYHLDYLNIGTTQNEDAEELWRQLIILLQ